MTPTTGRPDPEGLDQTTAATREGSSSDSWHVEKAASGLPREFLFIQSTDAGARTKVKRHVIREAIRQRQRRKTSSPISPMPWERTHCIEWAVSPITSEGKDSAEPLVDTPADEVVGDNRQFRIWLEKDTVASRPPLSLHPYRSPSPKMFLAQNTADPFRTYPVPTGTADDRLVHTYNKIIPRSLYNSTTLNACEELFKRLMLHDALSFQSILAVVAVIAALPQEKPATLLAYHHTKRLLKMTGDRMQQDPGPELLVAVQTLADLEDWQSNFDGMSIHHQGLRHLVRAQGGMKRIWVKDQIVAAVLWW